MELISLRGAQSIGPRPSVLRAGSVLRRCGLEIAGATILLTCEDVERQSQQCLLFSYTKLETHFGDSHDVDRGCCVDGEPEEC